MASILSWLLATPAIVLTLAFVVEVAAGLKRGGCAERTAPVPRSVVIVPAHNEAAGIARTVKALHDALPKGSDILVVADNCSDGTAGVARAAGSAVAVRNDPARRGKGYALHFARDRLAADPPAVVAVIDADCLIDGASLAALLSSGLEGPAQAVNLLKPDRTASAMVQVSNFAFMVKNLIRQRGLFRLSGRVHLTGTGMALPWALFSQVSLATADIVEDLGLGLDLAASGHRPRLVERATVWSDASTHGGTLQQRKRWEGGFLATSRRRALPAVASALRRFDAADLWAGLSLMVPPLALLVAFDLATASLLSLLLIVGGSGTALGLLVVSLGLAGVALTLAWARFGRPYLTAKAAIRLPLYLLWKLPLYLDLLRRKPTSWVRADRRQ